MPQETVANYPETFTHAEPRAGVVENTSDEQEIDMLDVTALLLRRKRTILKFALVTGAIAAILAYLVMKPMYTAEATFLPPQSAPGSGMSQLMSQLGPLTGLGALGGLKSPGDVYVGILKSRTIADDLIHRFDLEKVYKSKRMSDAAKVLKGRSTFVAGKDTLITISVEDHDPNRATSMANGYLDALYKQNGRLALTEASQRRLFFEQQLEQDKNALADAEVELKKTEEQTGLISPGGQAEMEIESVASVRAQLSSREIELGALKQAATDENPGVIRLQAEIDGLQQQLERLQSGAGTRQSPRVLPATAKVPALALEYVRKEREVKYRELLFQLIAKQYEAARLDEARESPVLQIVDRAVVPDKKSGPPRVLILLAGLLLGTMAGAGWVIVTDYVEKLQQDPVKAPKFEALREAASSRD
jgi:uncharacterized protein involved in exopolysaccharide biosynthesis